MIGLYQAVVDNQPAFFAPFGHLVFMVYGNYNYTVEKTSVAQAIFMLGCVFSYWLHVFLIMSLLKIIFVILGYDVYKSEFSLLHIRNIFNEITIPIFLLFMLLSCLLSLLFDPYLHG